MVYDERMDKECIPICDALNEIEGIETFESCCGHKKLPFLVAFTAERIDNLRPILIAIDDMHGLQKWDVRAVWASGGGAIYFILEGPVGASRAANLIAKRIRNIRLESMADVVELADTLDSKPSASA